MKEEKKMRKRKEKDITDKKRGEVEKNGASE
jgi:hypothetical protein